MAKVTVIDIDLGFNINDIITENAEALTSEAKAELDRVITVAKLVQQKKEEKSQEKSQAIDAITQSIAAAYEKLASAGEDGILCSDIMDIVKDHIPNTSAFALRMKKYLRDEGNKYALTRKKHKGNQHYVFLPFN